MKLIDQDWLAQKLLALGFSAEEVFRDVAVCVRSLNLCGIWDRWQFDDFAADDEIREELADVYGLNVGRPSGTLDPSGYCYWGPRIYRAPHEFRHLQVALIRGQIREFDESAANRKARIEAALPKPKRAPARKKKSKSRAKLRRVR